MKKEFEVSEDALPLIVETDFEKDYQEFVSWFNENKNFLEDKLLDIGALVLRGLDINNLQEFDSIINSISPSDSKFLDRNSPRSKHTSRVYNASEYDPDYKITMHTEYSYTSKWPSKLYFCCIKPALSGGETPVADCRKVLASLSPSLVEEFTRKKIRYIRNLHSGDGMGPSWQGSFETNERSELEQYCHENDIQYSWKKDGGVKLVQTRPAVRNHPITGDKVWFNQVDQFYPSIYGREIFESLLLINNNDVEELPMYATFGDGTHIEEEAIQEILSVFEKETIITPWEKGDILIVDNMLSLHGRMPYKGERKVLVAMS